MKNRVVPRLKREGPGHFIKQWRLHRGLTQTQLGERIDLSHGQISRLEQGKTRYTQDHLEAIAEALQCTPADLIMRNPMDPEGIWSIWDSLPPEDRQRIVAIGKTLREAS